VIAIDQDATGRDVLSFNDVIAKGRAALAKYARWREEALEVIPTISPP
jgi:hypothetical protein